MFNQIRLETLLKQEFDSQVLNKAKTLFYKRLSLLLHRHYNGKLEIMPKVPVWSPESFSVWYTPGVSEVSCQIRENNFLSNSLTLRGKTVAIVSDSTRVLGDGDCTPSGGLGVMEGKSLLLKYLAGVDAFPLCIDSRNSDGKSEAKRIVDTVKACSPSFAAINLEDISQPNCYQVLHQLQEELDIPVWHDDAQGTACIILAGILNSLKLVEKKISEAKIVLIGAGAAGSQIAEYLLKAGANPEKFYIFDDKGGLHKDRKDLEENPLFFKQWNLAKSTNPQKIDSPMLACENADIIIGVSAPNTITANMIKKMSENPIVFACANPVPEIYPEEAKKAGAFIVATGRSDFPNQLNNSLVFPGLLRAVIETASSKITDSMALVAAETIASHVKAEDLTPTNIVPKMEDSSLVSALVKNISTEIKQNKLNNLEVNPEFLAKKCDEEITRIRNYTNSIPFPPKNYIQEALQWTKENLSNS